MPTRELRASLAAVATLLALSLVAALTVGDDSAGQQVKAAAPPSTAPYDEPVEDTTTTTTTAPEPASAAAAPATATATAPAPAKPRSATATTVGAGRPSGAYPGAVSFPFQKGRTSWSATSNGIDMAISIDKPNPKTGEAVTFTMTLTQAAQKCCGFGLSFGGGAPTFYQDNSCPVENRTPTPGTVTTKATRAYNKAGRWQFTFHGWTLECNPDPAVHPLTAQLSGWVEVAPGGTPTSQGPSLPTFYGEVGRYGPTQYDNDPSYVTVHAKATDTDGYVAKLVVDYGDGATQTYPETQMGCRQAENGWPQESFMQTPNNPPPTHQYASPGTYKVTVTAYSQGCDGRDVQTASASFQHVYPAASSG